ncbi:MAG: type VI secretion system-associated protein TagF [Methylomonas sp.]|uniref:type VI secretion system-associated protein TagF n=1 Tax=Methylomonas sp. TaxID=418 RepID=UPI0025D25292|nr:type VI secretion system-associated protein TagF [Methylomonas sp.]MCK9608285.1 type VI secretion system-associated protein TagF [Methylomonas sp.]
MSRPDFAAGFYGKLPSHGDFLSRRLPRQFIEPWDQWLQGGIAASREQLGKGWLDTFLFSPIWQFTLAPGLCGDDAWAGVLMPSVDKVGRYFPLTLAAKVQSHRLKALFEPDCGWFDALSELALSSLDYEFDLQRFDADLEQLCLHDFLHEEAVQTPTRLLQPGSAKVAIQFQLDNNTETQQAFTELGDMLKDQFLARCSVWRSAGSEDEKASLLMCEGLPPLDAYVGFLNGQWPPRGWRFSSAKVKKKPEPAAKALDLPVEKITEPPAEDSHRVANPPVSTDPATYFKMLESALQAQTSQRQCFGLSVVGLRRKLNEDAILVRGDAGLWAIADGMGGHSAGDVASQALVEALANIPPIDDLEHYSEQVASSLQLVNRQLVELAKQRGNASIIGSTVVVLLISGKQFGYLWAGDSRLYRYRQGELKQLTLDHSLYNEAISQGVSPQDGSLEEGRGNVITRAVGADAQLQLDWGQGEICPGDLFILSSDGLDKELSHDDIAGFCGNGSVENITRSLINEAEQRGGRDNISVIAVQV